MFTLRQVECDFEDDFLEMFPKFWSVFLRKACNRQNLTHFRIDELKERVLKNMNKSFIHR